MMLHNKRVRSRGPCAPGLAAVLVALAFQVSLPLAAAPGVAWQELVTSADFVGVVECTQAGGIFAKYRAVDVWKGQPPGEPFVMRMTPDYWRRQFPIALVGERYLVAAFRGSPPLTLRNRVRGRPVPLWWRRVGHTYQLPRTGATLLPPRGAPFLGSDTPQRSLADFKAAVQAHLLVPPDRRELQALKRAAVGLRRRIAVDVQGEIELAGLLTARDVTQFVARLERHAGRVGPSAWTFAVQPVLANGDYQVRTILMKTSGRTDPLRTMPPIVRFSLMVDLERRVRGRLSGRRPDHARRPVRAPSDGELTRMEAQLRSDPAVRAFLKVFVPLAMFRPDALAEFFQKQKGPQGHWKAEHAYLAGAIMGRACRKNCESAFRGLTRARDPILRVAGAVYLSSQSAPAGLQALQALRNLPGEPGDWTALNLARRGDKTAVPRMLTLFQRRPGRRDLGTLRRRNLAGRALVLLSNSAAHSRVPFPNPRRLTPDRAFLVYAQWWRKYQSRITLHDPWLAELTRNKTD